MGVVGEAQIGHISEPYCQAPSVQRIGSSQLVPHCLSGSLQGEPAWGRGLGQPSAGLTHAQAGGSIVRQIGYSEPPWQSLQEQTWPSSYQQRSAGSLHAVPAAAGLGGQAAGLGSTEQLSSGWVIRHLPLSHTARVRQIGRGSSPQLQSAVLKPSPLAACAVQELPLLGGSDGQSLLEPPLPPVPPADVPAVVDPPEPPSLSPPEPPPGFVVPPHAASTHALATQNEK
jgi:hypothetical protein